MFVTLPRYGSLRVRAGSSRRREIRCRIRCHVPVTAVQRRFRRRGTPVGCSACHGLLGHDTDLLRQLGPASGARVHDRGRRRAGPSPPPARRGRLLPDRHRRARRQRGPRRRGRRPAAQAVLRRGVRSASAALAAAMESSTRLLHPHHRSRARAPRAGLRAATEGRRPPLRGHLRRPLLQLLRGLLRRGRPDPARQPAARSTQPPGRVGGGEATGSSRSRSGRRSCSSCTTPTPTSCARAPATTRPAR